MMVSFYSFVMAVLWFSASILLGTFLQRRTGFVFCYRLVPLMLFLALSVFRLVIPIETPFTVELHSTVAYPAVQDFLQSPWFTLGRVDVTTTYVFLAIWAAVAAVLCIRFLLELRRSHLSLQKINAVYCQRVERRLEELLSREGRRERVRLVVSPDIPTPMSVGLMRPAILLPMDCADLSPQGLECILRHELTHISGGDLWVKLFIRLLCCVMWWNPCVYLLQKDLDSVLEYKCDLAVTGPMSEMGKLEYLQTLVDVLRRLEKKTGGSAVAQSLQTCFTGIPETGDIGRRVQLVLEQDDHRKAPPKGIFIAVLFLLFIGSYSVVLQPASQPPPEDVVEGLLITPETSYILAATDGTYYLVCEDVYMGKVLPEELQDDPLCTLPIQNES